MKRLPQRAQERLLAGVAGDGSPPSFADMLRTLEVARGLPPRRRWQADLLRRNPALARVVVQEVMIPGSGAVAPARIYLPPPGREARGAALVWVHGGGFVVGDVDTPEAHWVTLRVAASGVPVVSLSYRLCLNGVHHPAPLDDVDAGWRWAHSHADEWGAAPDRVHLAGASAGAALALGVAVRARDAGAAQPAALGLVYPLLYVDSPPPTAAAAAALSALAPGELNEDLTRGSYVNYLGPTHDPDGADAAAVASSAVAEGLPPTLIVTCGRDHLRLHSEAYAEKLRREGVPLRHEMVSDAGHGVLDLPDTEHALEVIEILAAWLGQGDVPRRVPP